MSTSKLIELVASLGSYDEGHTIYATKPWTCDSEAVVALEEDRGSPHDAELPGAEYFVEVFVAREFLEGWIASEARSTSAEDQCERLIHYAVHDA